METSLQWTFPGQRRLWVSVRFKYKPHNFKHVYISARLQRPKLGLLPNIFEEMCPALSQLDPHVVPRSHYGFQLSL